MSLGELFRKYNYYAKPEGTAPLEKIIGCGKYGLLAGIICGTHDVLLYSRTRTTFDALRCLGFWIVPLTGMAATFASATYISTNLRKKDDTINYLIGAIASGGIFHAWQKNGLFTLYTTIFMCILATVQKNEPNKGWLPKQTPPTCRGVVPVFATPGTWKQTYERGWTK